MKRTRLRRSGVSETALLKKEIQRLVREVVMARDKGCILRKYRHCGGELNTEGVVIQADHLISRSNSATYADTRLIVCLCKTCHGWKHWHEKEYDRLIKTIISKERVVLWDRCEEERWKPKKMDWKLEALALERELSKLT